MKTLKLLCACLELALFACPLGACALAEAMAVPSEEEPAPVEAAADALPEALAAFDIGGEVDPTGDPAPFDGEPAPGPGDVSAPDTGAADPVLADGDVSGEEDPIADSDTPGGEDPIAEGGDPEAAPALTGFGLSISSITIGMGEKVDLMPFIRTEPADAACTLVFKSSKSRYVSVTQEGVITGKKKYSAAITVTANGAFSAKLKVKVKGKPGKVKLSVGAKTLGVGETTAFSSSVPKKTVSYARVYTLEPEGVLAVASPGVLRALQPGTCTLTVETYNGRHASAKITVLPAPDHLEPEPTALTLGPGVAADFCALLPEGTMGCIRYESLDPDIATVNASTGRITGVAAGDAVVRGVAHNGAEGACRVTVLPGPSAIAFEEPQVKVLVGQKWQPQVLIEPEGAYGGLTLTSSKPKIARIRDGMVEGIKKGTAVITARTCNGLTTKVTVKVPAAPSSISFTSPSLHLTPGESVALDYKLKGGETEVSYGTLTPEIATVDPETGEVTAIAPGTAVATVKTLNGKRAACMVNVDADPADTVDGPLVITFMDIGRNDGIVIRCGGESAFIDSGMHSQGVKAVKYMKKLGITHLKYYIGTHAHKDHVGGAAPVIAAFSPNIVLVPHGRVTSLIKSCTENKAERAAVKAAYYHNVKLDESFWLGGAHFQCLGPVKIRSASWASTKENVNSLILKVTYGSNTFLLTGDASGPELKEVQKKRPGSMAAQVLKNPHHNGKQEYAVKCANPEIVVISTDKSYLPSSSYVSWLKKRGCQVYCTASNRDSHVTITSDGSNLSVSTVK